LNLKHGYLLLVRIVQLGARRPPKHLGELCHEGRLMTCLTRHVFLTQLQRIVWSGFKIFSRKSRRNLLLFPELRQIAEQIDQLIAAQGGGQCGRHQREAARLDLVDFAVGHGNDFPRRVT
jgi:hypothetical protein